jgi:hypothetical protein
MKGPIWELLSASKEKMKINLFVFCFFLVISITAISQIPEKDFYFMFYNVENLFDIHDDPETADEEFTPIGIRHWTNRRLNKKLVNLSKVILNSTGWPTPHLIALCEVENRYVLEKLLKDTPLKTCTYKIIHKDSPDTRGIDVALLYNSNEFYPLDYMYFPLKGNTDTILATREILYVSGILGDADTIHIFVNHWPSRYSGLLESVEGRHIAAQTLRTCIDSVQTRYVNPKIIVAGDFNDQPFDESIALFLKAEKPTGDFENNRLYNLSWPMIKEDIKTMKYQMQWAVFDQLIVSGSLMKPENGLYTMTDWAMIAQLPYLLEKDVRYGGMKLNRTYIGYRYHGGFSDHLPVLLKLRQSP